MSTGMGEIEQSWGLWEPGTKLDEEVSRVIGKVNLVDGTKAWAYVQARAIAFGGSNFIDPTRMYYLGPGHHYHEVPAYSSDINAAWAIPEYFVRNRNRGEEGVGAFQRAIGGHDLVGMLGYQAAFALSMAALEAHADLGTTQSA